MTHQVRGDGAQALDADAIRRRLDLEVAEIRAAVDLVAAGAARRVDLAGLLYGDILWPRMRAEAADRGVRLELRTGMDDVDHDLVVSAADVP